METINRFFTLSILVLIILFSACKSSDSISERKEIRLLNKKELTKFEIKNDEVYVSGLINSKTYKQFVTLINENPQIKTIVEIDMEGSIDDDTMIKLAYFVREKGLDTKLLSYSHINSGAVDLFLAGVERTMEKGAHIGVHSWSDGKGKEAKDFPKESKEHNQNKKYIEDMLGEDSFYWFTIYAAPANGIYEMTEEEIQKYNLLTKPIITENLINPEKLPGTMVNKFGKYAFGNFPDYETVIVNAQGGPSLDFDLEGTYEIFINQTKIDLEKTIVINVEQEQTLKPWLFSTKEITFQQAKEYDEKSVERLAEVIKFFKNKGKKVYVVGISFGAFVLQNSLVKYGNIADKYLIMVGRLDMPKKVWEEFSKGNYVGFQYDKLGNKKIVNVDIDAAGMSGENAISNKNMAKLAAGLGCFNYTKLLMNVNLSNVTYAYGKKDEQVGSLNKNEIAFLKSKNVKVFIGEGSHDETINNLIKVSLDHLID